MINNRLKAGRALWIWRLSRRGEFPCNIEVLAVQGVDEAEIGDARQAVRDLVDDDKSPLVGDPWGYIDVKMDDDELEAWTREYALNHGLTSEELPRQLR